MKFGKILLGVYWVMENERRTSSNGIGRVKKKGWNEICTVLFLDTNMESFVKLRVYKLVLH